MGSTSLQACCGLFEDVGGSSIQSKGGVDDSCRFFNLLFFDRDRDFNFRCRNHANINSSFSQGLEHLGGYAGMAAHADAHTGKFGDPCFGFDGGVCGKLVEDRLEGALSPAEIIGVHGEGMPGQFIAGDV